MMRIAIVVNLVAYSFVVSQPLAYIVFMSHAQRALSAPAYIELRQRINAVMSRRVAVIYVGTLLTTLLLLVLAVRAPSRNVAVTTGVALLCLVLDVVFMMRENVPINVVIDRWSTTSYPDDWDQYRARWFAIFAYRQVFLLIGFFSLLIGAAFQEST
jgi:hypothetical protein